MRTLLQFIVLTVGSLLVLSGCASVADEPLAQIENTTSPTVVHTQAPQSEEVEVIEATPVDEESTVQVESTIIPTTESTEMTESEESEAVEADVMSNGFIFYNSHATW
jgi:hypothetical protein